jgi:hypothetical protein
MLSQFESSIVQLFIGVFLKYMNQGDVSCFNVNGLTFWQMVQQRVEFQNF